MGWQRVIVVGVFVVASFGWYVTDSNLAGQSTSEGKDESDVRPNQEIPPGTADSVHTQIQSAQYTKELRELQLSLHVFNGSDRDLYLMLADTAVLPPNRSESSYFCHTEQRAGQLIIDLSYPSSKRIQQKTSEPLSRCYPMYILTKAKSHVFFTYAVRFPFNAMGAFSNRLVHDAPSGECLVKVRVGIVQRPLEDFLATLQKRLPNVRTEDEYDHIATEWQVVCESNAVRLEF